MTDKEFKERALNSISHVPESREVIIERIREATERKRNFPDKWTGRDDHWLQMDGFALRCSYDRESNERWDTWHKILKGKE